MAAKSSSKTVIYAALAGNLLVAITKAGAAAWTGSSSMLSEAIHSFVDTLNEILLLYGMRRSVLRPDPGHPLGYGRELYFWSFIVALLIFALGAGISIYEGIGHVRRPEPISDPVVNYMSLRWRFCSKVRRGWFRSASFAPRRAISVTTRRFDGVKIRRLSWCYSRTVQR